MQPSSGRSGTDSGKETSRCFSQCRTAPGQSPATCTGKTGVDSTSTRSRSRGNGSRKPTRSQKSSARATISSTGMALALCWVLVREYGRCRNGGIRGGHQPALGQGPRRSRGGGPLRPAGQPLFLAQQGSQGRLVGPGLPADDGQVLPEVVRG